ncbi:related to 1-phosphatidylinositol phosphodiesterase precursor [Melanopsichium pennsylvanicum]|uniref:Related to 1-phosphatidylinositol phosphodiesterase n=2 Tax=Melanopsichium pennsylvanicum TaxID=63383 RepID=A0AAJ4XR86_9BASI|nr:related to 1-phosphatidylinositol phosphodiesterase precursor [Melanopsichium pennsylvanicum 4]SNX86989.1 related to 1-phosphatidylinositol phosphodiesterase precursor [Melanopsichium pennsylvanicum]
MRLPSFLHKEKQDAIAEKSAGLAPVNNSVPTATPAAVTTFDGDGHDSISLKIHNCTPHEYLAHSVFGALHTGNGVSQRVASSSLPSSPNPDSAVAAFGVRNTPVRLPAGRAIVVPAVRIHAFTAAATSGYTVDITLNPRLKVGPAVSGWSATLNAPAAAISTNSAECVVEGRLWKPLLLSPTVVSSTKSPNLGVSINKDDQTAVYALQSADVVTNTVHILLLPQRNLSTWMADLPSSDPISSFCIPGTHESCALYGWPISACQETTSTISVQLSRGIRFLDVRLSLKGTPGKQLLYAYHGVTDQKIEFGAILSQVYDFLTTNTSETVLMSVLQENNMSGFLDSVFKYINQNSTKWYLGTGIPKLADVRGKIVLISRFGSSDSQPGGIHPPIWPDSSSKPFNYTLPDGAMVWTQDWYNISSLSNIPTKLSLINSLLTTSGSDPAIFGLNFTNGSSFPFALPPWVAKGTGDQTKAAANGGGWLQNVGVNALLVDLIATRLKGGQAQWGKRGGLMNVIALDFFDQNNLGADLAGLMVQANFQ